jgi:hypothetical protein
LRRFVWTVSGILGELASTFILSQKTLEYAGASQNLFISAKPIRHEVLNNNFNISRKLGKFGKFFKKRSI